MSAKGNPSCDVKGAKPAPRRVYRSGAASRVRVDGLGARCRGGATRSEARVRISGLGGTPVFRYNFAFRSAGVAQLVEQRIRNAKVAGSTPVLGNAITPI